MIQDRGTVSEALFRVVTGFTSSEVLVNLITSPAGIALHGF
jgi:hypothetical protein